VTVDAPVPEALFAQPTPVAGSDVHDYTTDLRLRYTHDPNRTAAEWEALLDGARKARDEEARAKAARDALIGTTAPELPAEGWVNGPAQTRDALKGKAVVLIFWAASYEPHRPCAQWLRKADEGSKVVVIGVHTPARRQDRIRKALTAVGADGFVVIDQAPEKGASGGALYTHFRVERLPSAVLIGPDGKLAAYGDPGDMVRKAAELIEAGPRR
jgi:hypothetical protein